MKMLHRLLLLILLEAVPALCFSQRTTGGSNDGASNLRLTNVVCTTINTNVFIGGSSSTQTSVKLVNVNCGTVNSNPFFGGPGSGTAHVPLTNIVCPSVNANPFRGGSGDVNDNGRLVNIVCPVVNANPFRGGNSDGNDQAVLINIVCPNVNVNPFIGGSGDGHANSRVINITCPIINTNPFSGGAGDGHSNMQMINVVCTVANVNPYSGGIAAGSSKALLTNINCATLPIDLLALFATRDGDHINLYWSTFSEINNAYFTIEKSGDAENFTSFIQVEGHGNSTERIDYTSVDNDPLVGISFYRLKQTDFNGLFSYSNVVRMNYLPTELTLYPNPLVKQDQVVLACDLARANDLTVTIHDAVGAGIYQKTFSATKGANSFLLDLPNVSNGIYLAHLRLGAEEEKIVKLIVNR